MTVEADLHFLYNPSSKEWTTTARLRISGIPVLTGYSNHVREGSTGDPLDTTSTSYRSCEVLCFVSRYHILRRVCVEGGVAQKAPATTREADALDRVSSVSPSATAAAEAAPTTPHGVHGSADDCIRDGLVEVTKYSWRPYRVLAKHINKSGGAEMTASSLHACEGRSGATKSMSNLTGSSTGASFIHRGEGAGTAIVADDERICDEDMLPFSEARPFMSSTGGREEEDDDDEGDRLVLRFDSSSSPPSVTAEPESPNDAQLLLTAGTANLCVSAASVGDAGTTVMPVAESPNTVKAAFDAPLPTAGAMRDADGQTPPLERFTAIATATLADAPPPPRPRRLVVLRTDTTTTVAPTPASPDSALPPQAAVLTLPASQLTLSAIQGGRILHVEPVSPNLADAVASGSGTSRLCTGPTGALLHAERPLRGEAEVHDLRKRLEVGQPFDMAATDTVGLTAHTSRENSEKRGTSDAPDDEDAAVQPYLLSFECPCAATPVPEALPSDGAHRGATPGGPAKEPSTVVVHLEFDPITGRGNKALGSALLASGSWCHASVASCGKLEGAHRSSSGAATECRHQGPRPVAHSLALIVGEPSRWSCWMCPQVAYLTTGQGALRASGGCSDVWTTLNYKKESLANPHIDTWVRSVAGSVLCDGSDAGKWSRVATEAEVHAMMLPSGGAIRKPLRPAFFVPSRLSQLCCVLVPCADTRAGGPNPEDTEKEVGCKHDVLSCRNTALAVISSTQTRRCVWPSSLSPGLLWEATQVTPDCIRVSPHHLIYPVVSETASQSRVARTEATYWWLRCDPHTGGCDTLHTYLRNVSARWERLASSLKIPSFPSSSPSDVSWNPRAQSCSCSFLHVCVTRTCPPSLSLRGGAMGGAWGILVAEETLLSALLHDEVSGRLYRGKEVIQSADPVGAGVSALTIRARVAITSAMLQHLLWHAAQSGWDPASSIQLQVEGAQYDVGNAAQTPPQYPPSLDNDTALRIVCAARALAMQWICCNPFLLRDASTALLSFLSQERQLLSGLSYVGDVLQSASDSVEESRGDSTPSPASAAGICVLHGLQHLYREAIWVGLAWLSHNIGDIELMKGEQVQTLALFVAQQRLIGSTGLLPKWQRRLLATLSAQGERYADHWMAACLGVHQPRNVVRGAVDVRVEHAPAFSALQIHLEWTSLTAVSLPAPSSSSGSSGIGATVELPFLLLVFLLTPTSAIESYSSSSSSSSSASADEVEARPRAVVSSAVHLLQATPFSWQLDLTSCAAAGEKAATTVALMHTFDLVKHHRDMFKALQVYIPPCPTCKPTSHGARGSRGAAGRQRADALQGNKVASADGFSRAARGSPHGRRLPHKARQAGAKVFSAKGNDAEVLDGSADFPSEEDSDGDTLVLNLGKRRGGRTVAAASSALSSRQPDGAGFASEAPSRSEGLGEARVIPVVVFRQDAAAPILEVEVHQARALAMQLAAGGYQAPRSHRSDDSGDEAVQPSATLTVCSLLHHWIGFSCVYAAAPQLVANLRARQRESDLASLAHSDDQVVLSSALMEPTVLSAYLCLVKSWWSALRDGAPSLSSSFSSEAVERGRAIAAMISTDVALSHILNPDNSKAAVNDAIAVYSHYEFEYRSRLLRAERERGECVRDDVAELLDEMQSSAGRTTPHRGKSTKQKAQQYEKKRRQLLVVENAAEETARAVWAPVRADVDEIVSLFYRETLEQPLSASSSPAIISNNFSSVNRQPIIPVQNSGTMERASLGHHALPVHTLALEQRRIFEALLRHSTWRTEEASEVRCTAETRPSRSSDASLKAVTRRQPYRGEPSSTPAATFALGTSPASPREHSSSSCMATLTTLVRNCAGPSRRLVSLGAANSQRKRRRVDVNDEERADMSSGWPVARELLCKGIDEIILGKENTNGYSGRASAAARLALSLVQLLSRDTAHGQAA